MTNRIRTSLTVLAVIVTTLLFAVQPVAAMTEVYNFVTQWGSYGSGDGQFQDPIGVAVDALGNVYVADTYNYQIQKFDSTGAFLAKWGSQGGADGQFNYPIGVAVDALGNVYVADYYYHRIQKFDTNGAFLAKWGSQGGADGQFQFPYGVAVDALGSVYVADTENHRIQKFDSTGAFLAKWGAQGGADGQFQYPYGVAVDALGNVYVADFFNRRIQKFDSTGAFLAKWGSQGGADGQFQYPSGVAVDASGNVYVADTYNHRIQKFDSTGAFLAKWGSQGGADGQFQYPIGVAVYASGNVYVADYSNNRIQKFSPTIFYDVVGSAPGGNGSISCDTSVTGGGSSVCTPSPAVGYQLSALTDNSVDALAQVAGGTYTISNISADHAVVATFTTINFAISATAGAGGSINPSGTVYVSPGASQLFTITPDTGYHIAGVLVDGGPVTVTNPNAAFSYIFPGVSANHTIDASFAINMYTVTSSVFGGHGTLSCVSPVAYGGSSACTITPAYGYQLATLRDNGANVFGMAAGNTYTILNVIANHRVTGSFTAILIPDLTAGWSSLSANRSGKVITGSLQVKNTWKRNAGAFSVAFYLSTDGTTPGALLRTMAVSSLAAGATRNISFSYTSATSLRGKYVIAVVDSGSQVAELSETNNTAAARIR